MSEFCDYKLILWDFFRINFSILLIVYHLNRYHLCYWIVYADAAYSNSRENVLSFLLAAGCMSYCDIALSCFLLFCSTLFCITLKLIPSACHLFAFYCFWFHVLLVQAHNCCLKFALMCHCYRYKSISNSCLSSTVLN